VTGCNLYPNVVTRVAPELRSIFLFPSENNNTIGQELEVRSWLLFIGFKVV
jgi:hypothetical protein